jgi:hypothetical protein
MPEEEVPGGARNRACVLVMVSWRFGRVHAVVRQCTAGQWHWNFIADGAGGKRSWCRGRGQLQRMRHLCCLNWQAKNTFSIMGETQLRFRLDHQTNE